MDCLYTQNLLSAYLDDELNPEEKRMLRKHFFTCAQCQQELNQLQFTKLLVANLNTIEAPIDFAAVVKYKLTKEKGPQFYFILLRWLTVTAATFVFWVLPSFATLTFNEKFLTEEQIIALNLQSGRNNLASSHNSLLVSSTTPLKANTENKNKDEENPVDINTILVNSPR